MVPLEPGVWQALAEHLERSWRTLESEQPEAPLVRPMRKNRTRELEKVLDSWTVWWLVKRYVKRAGIKERISPHSLWHTSITLALDGGATIRQAQTFAGHADPKTTVRYDRTREDLDKSAAYLIHLRNETGLWLTVEHRAAPSTAALRLELTERGDALALEIVDAAAASVEPTPSVADRVEEVLTRAAGPVPVTALRALCKIRTDGLYKVLAQLTNEGRVRKTQRGYSVGLSAMEPTAASLSQPP